MKTFKGRNKDRKLPEDFKYSGIPQTELYILKINSDTHTIEDYFRPAALTEEEALTEAGQLYMSNPGYYFQVRKILIDQWNTNTNDWATMEEKIQLIQTWIYNTQKTLLLFSSLQEQFAEIKAETTKTKIHKRLDSKPNPELEFILNKLQKETTGMTCQQMVEALEEILTEQFTELQIRMKVVSYLNTIKKLGHNLIKSGKIYKLEGTK